MAEQTIAGQKWPEGTVITVYPASAWVDRSRSPVGASVTSSTVSSGSVTFGGLTENTSYVAYGGSVGVTFMATVEGLQTPVARPDRERIKALEDAAGEGGGGTGGGHEIQDEGSSLTQRDVLNFTGAGVSAADAGGKTVITVPGASANTLLYDDGLGEWPARPTDDDTVSYLWIGPDFPTVGGAGGFVSNVDVFIPNAEVTGGGETALEWVQATLGTNVSHLMAESDPDSYYYVQYVRDGDQLHMRGVALVTAGATVLMTLPDVSPRVRPLSYQARVVRGDGGPRTITFAPNGTITLDVSVAFVYMECSIWLDVDPFA